MPRGLFRRNICVLDAPTPSAPSAARTSTARRQSCSDGAPTTLKITRPDTKRADLDVESRRLRLRRNLEAAQGLEALVRSAEDFQRQELSFDPQMAPALEFMAVMGKLPGEVFKSLLEQLHCRLAETARKSDRDRVEQVLADMLRQRSAPEMIDFIVVLLQRLSALPSPGSSPLEREAVECLVKLVRSGSQQLFRLPQQLRQRVWEQEPELFWNRALPLVVRFVHGLRRKVGPLLEELRQKSTEQLRKDNAALQEILDLVGNRPELYRSLRRHLLAASKLDARTAPLGRDKSRASTHVLSLNSGEGSLDGLSLGAGRDIEEEEACEEVIAMSGLYAEPFLGTLRAEVLMGLVDRRMLHPSITGTWLISSDFAGGSCSYAMSLVQSGHEIRGTSKLEGISSVTGAVSGSKLTLIQHGATTSYVCTCEVLPGLMSLSHGKWQQKPSSDLPALDLMQGTFSGVREGPLNFADAEGNVWDEMASLIIWSDRVQQHRGGIDAAFCAELQQISQAHVAACESEPERDRILDVDLLLSDPCMIMSLVRGLLAMRGVTDHSTAELSSGLEACTVLQLIMASSHLSSRETAVSRGPLGTLIEIAKGPPSAEHLAAIGLPLAILRSYRRPDEEGVPAINQAVRSACSGLPRTAQALHVLRILLSSLVTSNLLLRRHTPLQECLQLALDASTAACALLQKDTKGRRADWVERQMVDKLVSSAIHLKDFFDASLRKLVLGYLFPLAREDAWVHTRVAHLLAEVYQRPHFVPSREESTSLKLLLGECDQSGEGARGEDCHIGKWKDERYDWGRKLAKKYSSIVQGKGYLRNIYDRSRLGAAFPIDGEWTVESRQVVADLRPEPVNPTNAYPFDDSPSLASTSSPASAQHGSVPSLSPVGAAKRQRMMQKARRVLAMEDAVMNTRVGDRIQDLCVAISPVVGNADVRCDEAAARFHEVVELLTTSFRGYHWLCHLAQRWIAKLTGCLASASGLLRDLMRRCMVEAFDARCAERVLMLGGPMPGWLDAFISVPEWRRVVYELVKRAKGPASSLVSCMLRQISDKEGHEEELQSHGSSTSNFIVFCRTLRGELTRFFALLKESDDSPTLSSVAEICRVCSSSEYTYAYAQAILNQAMRVRPYWIDALRHLSQRLTESASAKSGSVLRLDLRFSPLAEYPEILKVLHLMFRFGRDVRVYPTDIVRLCVLVEGLLDPDGHWNRPPPPSELCQGSGPAADSVDKSILVVADDVPEDLRWVDGDDNCTEIASDAGSFMESLAGGDDREDVGSSAWEDFAETDDDPWASVVSEPVRAAENEGSCGGQGSAHAGANRKMRPQRSDPEHSEKTASIFHMPAVSSAASAQRRAEAGLADGEEGNHAAGLATSLSPGPFGGLAGVLQALRRPPILEALVARFVDPSVLDEIERRSFARLLALLTVDGLWVSGPLLDTARQDLEDARARAVAVEQELEKVYDAIHHPQHSWLRKVATMSRLQQYPVSSIAGLRWLEHVILGKRLTTTEQRTRLSHSILYVFLRRAVDAHPLQGHSVLNIVRRILQLLPNTEDNQALPGLLQEQSQFRIQNCIFREGDHHSAAGGGHDNENEMAGDVVTSTRSLGAGGHTVRISRMISIMLVYLVVLPELTSNVLELVSEQDTTAAVDHTALHFFVKEMLTIARPPFTSLFAWRMSGFLAKPEFFPLDAPLETQNLVRSFCLEWRVIASNSVCENPSVEQRYAETLANLALAESRLSRKPERSDDWLARVDDSVGHPSFAVEALGSSDAMEAMGGSSRRGDCNAPLIVTDAEVGRKAASSRSLPAAGATACPMVSSTSEELVSGNPNLVNEVCETWQWWEQQNNSKHRVRSSGAQKISGKSQKSRSKTTGGKLSQGAESSHPKITGKKLKFGKTSTDGTPSSIAPTPSRSTRRTCPDVAHTSVAASASRFPARRSCASASTATKPLGKRRRQTSESSSEEYLDSDVIVESIELLSGVQPSQTVGKRNQGEDVPLVTRGVVEEDIAKPPQMKARRLRIQTSGATESGSRHHEADARQGEVHRDEMNLSASSPPQAPLQLAAERSWSLSSLQGRWRHSIDRIGWFVLRGNVAELESGEPLGHITLRSEDGVPELGGFVASTEESTADRVVWRRCVDGASVVWTRE